MMYKTYNQEGDRLNDLSFSVNIYNHKTTTMLLKLGIMPTFSMQYFGGISIDIFVMNKM